MKPSPRPKSPSDSQPQREAERLIFARVRSALGCALKENPTIPLPGSNCAIVPDLYSDNPPIAGEIFAHTGALKVGQRHKLAGDILKLLLLERSTGRAHRKILAVCDPEVERFLRGDSWLAQSVRQFGIELICVELDAEEMRTLRDAQARQAMVNPGDSSSQREV